MDAISDGARVFQITLREHSGIPRTNEFVRVGLPLAPTAATLDTAWSLVHQGRSVPVQVRPTSVWPDGSVRWLMVEFFATLAPRARASYHLKIANGIDQVPKPKLSVIDQSDCYWIDTGLQRFRVDKRGLVPPAPEWSCGVARGAIRFRDASGRPCPIRLEASEILDPGPLSKSIVQTGMIDVDSGSKPLRIRSELTFLAGKTEVRWRLTLHNPRAASHPGGTWDLGDPASILFEDFSIVIPCPQQSHYRWRPVDASQWVVANADLTIYQESSGGTNFTSANHRNRNGLVPVKQKGYAVHVGGERVFQGLRASPTVHATADGGSVTARIRGFWERWPKAIRCRADQLEMGLFPTEYPDLFELQPGESTTHEVILSFNTGAESLDGVETPLVPTVEPGVYSAGLACIKLDADREDDELTKLLNEGLDPERGFFAKREHIDEFGWRNFGDVYADHEANAGSPALISHYNNQYDLIYGFGRRFIETGDPRWFELHKDLAQHVYDIDIYKTEDDKPEYNGGLFWHTDHYCDAGLSTHRSFSREQPKGSYQDHNRGGGPGAEHCYARGLALHYHLTGDELSRQACLSLVKWMNRSFGERAPILSWALRCLRHDVPKMLSVLRGYPTVRFRYPLTRATGNYIRGLLDAFDLTGDRSYLELIDRTIQQTAHPEEHIELRGLHNVEATWSYTVFLTAVGEYLRTKEILQELDEGFIFGRDVLCRFADWMVENERPYLEVPEILEFPNHTWTAQDARKATVLYYAYRYAPVARPDYLTKARFFANHVLRTLREVSDRNQTRILAILLQNAEPLRAILDSSAPRPEGLPGRGTYDAPACYRFSTLVRDLAVELRQHLRQLSLKNELTWIRTRLR